MIPRLPQPSSDPGSANTSGEICRNFIWGTCNKHTQCIFRHELDIEKMRDILQFCHDYQNRNRCTRENCKYLHATKEEQDLFNTKGQIPRVLAERHAALASGATSMNAETIPQIAMFIRESCMTQPPPALWPPLPPPQAALQPASGAPPPPPASPPRLAPAHQPVPQAQQPPPPPAPTPALVPPNQIRPAPTTYPGMSTQIFSMNQPPPMVPPNFDATRPPPPIPVHVLSQQLKRKLDNGNAGPNKLRKPEGPDGSESLCEGCVQRELRIDGYKIQMETLHNEEECQILNYKKKLQQYEIGRDILKTLVGPELFRLFDDLIEGSQTPHDNLTNLNSSSSLISGSSSMQAILLEMLLNGGQRNIIEPMPSTSRVDETLQSLTRRLHVANYANPGPDLTNLVIETLRNSNVPERSPSLELRSSDAPDNNRLNNNRANGLNHLTNGGQKSQPSPISETVRYGVAGYSGQNQDYGPRMHQSVPNYPVAGPSGYTGSASGPALPHPAVYPIYHPAIPPPSNRQYYAPNPAPSNAPNMPFNGADRLPAPGPNQGLQPPTSSGVLRPNQPSASNYNFIGRYPQQPYFPPYQ